MVHHVQDKAFIWEVGVMATDILRLENVALMGGLSIKGAGRSGGELGEGSCS